MYWWPAYTIAQSMAEYAFWLQHETSRANKPLVRDFHKAGWFERRISWFLELMDVMEVTMEMLETDMESLRVKETRTEKIDPTETARSFLEALEEVRDKDCERETG
jgi:lipopolysaccharide biosynthesis regulator YciM